MHQAPGSLSGEIVKVVSPPSDSGWCCVHVRDDAGRTATLVGGLPRADEGLRVEADGAWVTHPRFGSQFRAEATRVFPPRDVGGIERFLRSGAVHGVGPHFAAKIVRAFGARTLDVIRDDPYALKYVKGVGAKRIEAVITGVREYYDVLEVMSFLHRRFGPVRAARIFEKYGREAQALLAREPYRLVEDFDGIGFALADEVARDVGMTDEHPQRLRAAVSFVLKQAAQRGHTCVVEARCAQEIDALLGAPAGTGLRALARAADEGEIGVLDHEGERVVELEHYRWLEQRVTERLQVLLSTPPGTPTIDADRAVPWAEAQVKLAFEAEQSAAIRQALSAKVSVITGGPGVGKTTILRGVLAILRAKKLRVLLAAPTGRAARRMADSTGVPAETLHRMLDAQPGRGGFQFNAGRRLAADVVVVDETSMMDLGLARALLEALPDDVRCVLVGDQDQLPSVGPGQVLADLIASAAVPVARLTKPFRQAAGSPIIRNAHAVNRGETPDLLGGGPGFRFIETADAAATAAAIVATVCDGPSGSGGDPRRDCMVLVPMNRGAIGVDALNDVLQARLNPAPPDAIERGGRRYGVGDRVIQRKNDRELGVFNGDLGVIRAIDQAAKILQIDFEGRVIPYPASALGALDLAYAITVHRSQGSEYRTAVIAVDLSTSVMLDRKLLYTAITRAKHEVVLVGQPRALHIGVSQSRANQRHTLLAGRLAAALESPARGAVPRGRASP